MKDIEKIKKLIAQLKTEAENEFELHRISVLERDLIQGLPVVEIIDEKFQSFNGKKYHVTKSGHYTRSCSLHQEVWQYYRGTIPQDNYQIHHIDWDAANNSIKNLQLLTISEHFSIHANTPPPEVAESKIEQFTCARCGKSFRTAIRSGHKYCSRSCQRAAQLEAKKTHEKICLFCGAKFLGESNSKYCSRECHRAHVKSKTPAKICPQCGKEFRDAQNPNKIYCSKECQNAARRLTSEELRASNNPNARVVTCKNCGKEFTTLHPLKCYCSEDCKKEYEKKRIHIYKKTCPICGKEFSGIKRQKHCSRECRDQARRNTLKLFEKKCPTCGKIFKTRDKRVKYCSRDCYRVSKKTAKYAPPQKKHTRTCLQCGKTFITADKNSKYCSKECYHTATRTLPDKICPTCGKLFHPSGKARKFCSRACIRHEKSHRTEISKICPVCGKEFKPSDKRVIYCSSECAGVAHRNTLRTCPVCGKEFFNKPEGQIHCSRHCANIARRTPLKKCAVCGKEFHPFHSVKSKYCSKECACTPLKNG